MGQMLAKERPITLFFRLSKETLHVEHLVNFAFGGERHLHGLLSHDLLLSLLCCYASAVQVVDLGHILRLTLIVITDALNASRGLFMCIWCGHSKRVSIQVTVNLLHLFTLDSYLSQLVSRAIY